MLCCSQAFEAYDSNKDERAVKCLKYMCLCKVQPPPSSPPNLYAYITIGLSELLLLCPSSAQILGGHPSDVPSILSGKHGLKYAGSNNADLTAMAEVAQSAKKRSLEDFEATVLKFNAVLKTDDLIDHHLEVLYDQMLEANLLKIVGPFRYGEWDWSLQCVCVCAD